MTILRFHDLTIGRLGQLGFEPGGEVVEGETILDPHVAHTRSAEGSEMGAAAQCLTDVACQRADIGALATHHAQLELHRLRVEVLQLDLVDADGFGCQLMVTALASQFIGSVAGPRNEAVSALSAHG